jgi:sec-independent protein translocase protein TatB
MFNLGFSELIIIGVIALIFIGPRELPEVARVIGRMLNELKRATGELSSSVLQPKEHLERELRSTVDAIHQPIETTNSNSEPEPEKPPAEEKKV